MFVCIAMCMLPWLGGDDTAMGDGNPGFSGDQNALRKRKQSKPFNLSQYKKYDIA
jgi:hypothetical protein